MNLFLAILLAAYAGAPANHAFMEQPIAPFEIPEELGVDSTPYTFNIPAAQDMDIRAASTMQFKPIEQILAEQRAIQATQTPEQIQQNLQAAASQEIWSAGQNSSEAWEEEGEDEEYDEYDEYDESEDYEDVTDYDELLQGVGFYKNGQLYPFQS